MTKRIFRELALFAACLAVAVWASGPARAAVPTFEGAVMAFVPQNSDGTAAGANSYLTVAEFKSYHDDRGQSYGTATDPTIQAKLVVATGYLDTRFRFVGQKAQGRDQTTQWPRTSAYDSDRRLVQGIPQEVRAACAEYALRALAAPLLPDPLQDVTGTRVVQKEEQVGPLKEVTRYEEAATYQLPKYPVADQLLRSSGLALAGGSLARG